MAKSSFFGITLLRIMIVSWSPASSESRHKAYNAYQRRQHNYMLLRYEKQSKQRQNIQTRVGLTFDGILTAATLTN